MSVLAGFATFVAGVRTALLYAGVFVAAVCLADWAVRTRRINPFSRFARHFRGRIEPLMQPVERVIVRTGGSPSSAPLWVFVAFVVFGILLIGLLQFIGGILTQVIFASQDPSPRSILILLASWSFSILRLAVLVRVLSTWLPVSPRSKWIWWSYVLTEWFIRPMQRIIPRIGMIDITPIVAWILLGLIQSALGIP